MPPPVAVIALLREPLRSVPPIKATALIVWAKPPRSSAPAFNVVMEAALNAFAAVAESVPPKMVVAPVYEFEPVIVVAPDVTVSVAAPPMLSSPPPEEDTAPVSEPFLSKPPVSVTELIVCAKPPRSSAPPLTVIAEPALKACAPPAASVPPATLVAPV